MIMTGSIFAAIFMLTYIAAKQLGFDAPLKISTALTGICAAAYGFYRQRKSAAREQADENTPEDGSVPQRHAYNHNTQNMDKDMNTKDLVIKLLEKMNVKTAADKEDEDRLWMEYKGETISIRASKDKRFVVAFDTFWRKYPTANLESVSLARKAINQANTEYNGFKLLYTFSDDTMWIHSSHFFLLVPEISDIEEYFESMLDSLLSSHKAFDDAMFDVMKEQKDD